MELGLAWYCLGKMGFRSLGIGSKCQIWERDNHYITMTSSIIVNLENVSRNLILSMII